MGRPSAEESRRRLEAMLEIALDTFLEQGYERTTMAGIAMAAGMSKRTLYANYEDKDDLFNAAIELAVSRYTVSKDKLDISDPSDLEKTLIEIAHIRIDNVATPEGIRLQRILTTQSYRFPELFTRAFEQSISPTIELLVDLFEQHNTSGTTDISEPQRAATAFLGLVVGGPARSITAGNTLSKKEIEEHVRYAVGLFLNGIRKR